MFKCYDHLNGLFEQILCNLRVLTGRIGRCGSRENGGSEFGLRGGDGSQAHPLVKQEKTLNFIPLH